MGIEETFERIAVALERIASTQEENTKINAWYKDHLAGKSPVVLASEVKEVPCVGEASQPVAPMDSAAPAAEPEKAPSEEAALLLMTFEELKSALHLRGHDYPKGTKRTTLAKEWARFKDDPILPHEPSPVEPPPLDVNPAGYAPSLTEAPAPAPAESPAPEPESAKPLSRDEAAARIRAHYTASSEDREIFKKALVAAGVQENGSFRDVPDGKFDILVETYEHLKGIANA